MLLFGGIETTEGMIANALVHLLERPDALAAVRADPGALPAAVEESLRLEPAAAVDRPLRDARHRARRRRDRRRGAGADLDHAANRDPATFADPDRFDLARANAGRHLAFAGGPHVCVGMHLARLEAHVALATLLERLPGLRLDPAPARDPRPRVPQAAGAARALGGGGAVTIRGRLDEQAGASTPGGPTCPAR